VDDAEAGMKTEDALAGDGRGADEEPQLPLPRNNRRLGLRCRASQLNEDDGGCHHRCRRRCVHHNAKLAVVGVDGAGMQVRGLGKRQGDEQGQAQSRNDRQNLDPAALLSAEKPLKCFQNLPQSHLILRILQEPLFLLDVRCSVWLPQGTHSSRMFDSSLTWILQLMASIQNQPRLPRFV
jgi:hypothetical protein